MNKHLIKFLLTLSCYFISYSLFSQGATVYVGYSSAKNQHEMLTVEGTKHTGYHIGADGKLGDEQFYFLVGGQWHKLSFLSTNKAKFSPDDPTLKIIKGRAGVAFKLFGIGDIFTTRLRFIGNIDYIFEYPQETNPDLNLNEAVAGISSGLEFDISFITLNFEYQKGFFNMINQTDQSSLNFFTANLGVSF